jgi:hypothetical protein
MSDLRVSHGTISSNTWTPGVGPEPSHARRDSDVGPASVARDGFIEHVDARRRT